MTSLSLLNYFAPRQITFDASQQVALIDLQNCIDQWVRYKKKRTSTLQRLINHPDFPRGVYLYGTFGTGKSLLMDGFFAVVPVARKWRVHFHVFMHFVHTELHRLRGQDDPLQMLANQIAKKYRLICFDEFHVSDIADAMMLYRLLDSLFSSGVCFIMTSNYHPDDLYPNGLHRERMLPAIALIKSKMGITRVGIGVDYRQSFLRDEHMYHTPLGESSNTAFRRIYEGITHGVDDPALMEIEGRLITAIRRSGKVLWIEFNTLCKDANGKSDYLALSQFFDTILLANVPVLTAEMANTARRFTWLIDVLYDHKIRLIISAAAQPDQLYPEGEYFSEFQRTASRLIEMRAQV